MVSEYTTVGWNFRDDKPYWGKLVSRFAILNSLVDAKAFKYRTNAQIILVPVQLSFPVLMLLYR